MSDVIISVEGLGKKYVLSHQGERGGYTRFSERLQEAITKPFRALAGDRRKKIGDRQNPLSPNSYLLSTPDKEEFWALKDVSFEVKRGEVVGIIGRNGAGKSTLLKILSRITEPTEGRVTLRGRVASLLEVGTGFHPELTGRENIFLNGAILGMSKAEIRKKFDEIVAFAEVERFLDTPVKRYSSGMYVRLAFAVAAHLEPEILIVDEVLAVGDAEFQKKCLGKMKDVATGGRTVLFVSHALGSVQELCDRALVMKNGKKSFDGRTTPAIAYYRNQSSTRPVNEKAKFFSYAGANKLVQIFFGEPCTFDFFADLPQEISCGINISIHDAENKLVSLYSTNPHEGVALPRGVKKKIRFSINPCLLSPGKYSIDISLTDPGVKILQENQEAFVLEVTEKTVGGTWPYRKEYGVSYLPHSWSID